MLGTELDFFIFLCDVKDLRTCRLRLQIPFPVICLGSVALSTLGTVLLLRRLLEGKLIIVIRTTLKINELAFSWCQVIK